MFELTWKFKVFPAHLSGLSDRIETIDSLGRKKFECKCLLLWKKCLNLECHFQEMCKTFSVSFDVEKQEDNKNDVVSNIASDGLTDEARIGTKTRQVGQNFGV